jgi:hypothetical protein
MRTRLSNWLCHAGTPLATAREFSEQDWDVLVINCMRDLAVPDSAVRDRDRCHEEAAPLVRFRINFTEHSMVGPGKICLLEAIRDAGSLSAGRNIGMSYLLLGP